MKKKKRKIYLYLLIILGLTVGFALLSTTLYINGTAGIKANTWDIHWDEESIQVTENSVQAETPIVTEEGQKVSYAVTLELPGDFYEFTIDAVNAGTIDGMVSVGSIEPVVKNKTTGEVTTLPSYIKYSVTYADGAPVEQYHLLPKRVDASTPTREKFKVRIEYDSNSSTLPSEDLEYAIDDELPYIPDDGRGKDRHDNDGLYFDGESFTNTKPIEGIYLKFPKDAASKEYVMVSRDFIISKDQFTLQSIPTYQNELACVAYKAQFIEDNVVNHDKLNMTEEEFREYADNYLMCVPKEASSVCANKNNKELCFSSNDTLTFDCDYNSETNSCNNTTGFTAGIINSLKEFGLNICIIESGGAYMGCVNIQDNDDSEYLGFLQSEGFMSFSDKDKNIMVSSYDEAIPNFRIRNTN